MAEEDIVEVEGKITAVLPRHHVSALNCKTVTKSWPTYPQVKKAFHQNYRW